MFFCDNNRSNFIEKIIIIYKKFCSNKYLQEKYTARKRKNQRKPPTVIWLTFYNFREHNYRLSENKGYVVCTGTLPVFYLGRDLTHCEFGLILKTQFCIKWVQGYDSARIIGIVSDGSSCVPPQDCVP